MGAVRTFWASFLDGFTMTGIFGDLRIPGAATRVFARDDDDRQLTPQGNGSDKREILRDHSGC